MSILAKKFEYIKENVVGGRLAVPHASNHYTGSDCSYSGQSRIFCIRWQQESDFEFSSFSLRN